MLCSLLFDAPLTAVTMDTLQTWLFVGASNGSITQINLFLPVSLYCNIHGCNLAWRTCNVYICCILPLYRMCIGVVRHQATRVDLRIKATRE